MKWETSLKEKKNEKQKTTVFGEQGDGYERATKFVIATIVVKETFQLLYDYRKFRILQATVCIV